MESLNRSWGRVDGRGEDVGDDGDEVDVVRPFIQGREVGSPLPGIRKDQI